MVIRLLTLLVFLLPALAVADVYKYVDEDGNVSYSDEPREGAERMESPQPGSTYQFRAPRQQPSSADDDADGSEQAAYQSLRILHPEHEGTVRDNEGHLDVQVTVEPSLREGHRFQFVLNGETRGEPTRSSNERLTEVHRGEHQLQVRIIDGAGETVAETESITFYMHQASRLMPGRQQGGGTNPGGIAFPGN